MSPRACCIVALAALTAVLMEAWAAIMHGKLWHGVLWPTHRSHHRGPGDVAEAPRPAHGLEFNDVFGLLHALLAAPMMAWGMHVPVGAGRAAALGISIGMSAYGLAYALVHDGMVHQRLPLGVLKRSRTLRRVAAAHRVHHRTGGPPFGLFSGPWVLRRAAARRAAERALPRSRPLATPEHPQGTARAPRARPGPDPSGAAACSPLASAGVPPS